MPSYYDRALAALDAAGIRTHYAGQPTYAVNVALGRQRLSGGDLRGAARHFYGGRYARIRERVLDALTRAGVAREERGPRKSRYLVDTETGMPVNGGVNPYA